MPPPGSPEKVARDTTEVCGNGQALYSITMKVSNLLYFTLGKPYASQQYTAGVDAGKQVQPRLLRQAAPSCRTSPPSFKSTVED